jgi:hypothetical protein
MRYPFPLPTGWFHVADPGEVQPGAAIRRSCFGTELVVERSVDGSPSAHEVGRPERPWPAVERNGATFVWHDPGRGEPTWEVPDLPPFTAPAEAGTIEAETRLEIGACLQEITENGYDRAHLPHVHGTAAAHEVTFTELGDHRSHLATVLRYETARGVVEQRIDNHGYGPGLGLVHFAGVVDTWFLATALPLTADRTEVRFRYRFRAPDGGPADPRAARGYQAEIERQYRQDQVIWEHKAYLTRPLLTEGEALITRFRRWYERFYNDGATDADPGTTQQTVWPPPAPQPAPRTG